MTCPNCGREGADDPETGYSADELCPTCKADGWDIDNDGNLFHEVPGGRLLVQPLWYYRKLASGHIFGPCLPFDYNETEKEDLECPF